MSTFNSLDEAQEFFKNDTFATNNGMKIECINEDGCVCSMDITKDHRNAYGGIMGGVIFTLGDFAFAVASNNVHTPTVALNVNVDPVLGVGKNNDVISEVPRKTAQNPTFLNRFLKALGDVVEKID